MNMRHAMRETLELARSRDYDNVSFEEVGVDFDHLVSMQLRFESADPPFSEAKMGRWLGYVQGVLVANGCLTLEECKQLNARYAG